MPPVIANIDGIKVDTAIIRVIAGRMRYFSQQMYEALQDARQKINNMQTDAVWLSPAGQLIIDQMNRLQPRKERQREALHQFCDFLDSTAEKYEQAEFVRHMDAAGV